MIRYIAVIHYFYDSTEPAEADGEDKPIPTYATREEAEAVARTETGPQTEGYVWAVKV